MIRTDIDIKDDIYDWVKKSVVGGMINGGIYKESRPLNSKKEDIIISVLTRDAGDQIQDAFVNINIYVPDIRRGDEAIEDTKRLRALCKTASEDFEYDRDDEHIFRLDSQAVMKANGIDWHIINNQVHIRYNNE